MTVPKQQDLVDAIIADHRVVAELFDELEASGDARNRGRLAEQVIAELMRHAVAEEQYLYPTAREVLPDGDELADHEIAAHADAEQVMKELSRTDPASPAFDALVSSLIGDVRQHIAHEERDLLPRLRATCDAADLRELGLKFEQGKKIAPTRPHPFAPHQPTASKILGPGMALIDKVRDAVTRRGK